jgi:hypothetical protein
MLESASSKTFVVSIDTLIVSNDFGRLIHPCTSSGPSGYVVAACTVSSALRFDCDLRRRDRGVGGLSLPWDDFGPRRRRRWPRLLNDPLLLPTEDRNETSRKATISTFHSSLIHCNDEISLLLCCPQPPRSVETQ